MFERYLSVHYDVCHGDHRHGDYLHGYHDCLHGDDDDGACDADFLSSLPTKYFVRLK